MSKFGFITLLCIALGLTVTAFKPASIGSGISSETVFAGP